MTSSLPEDYIAAVALALEAAADHKTAITVIQAIVDAGPRVNGQRTEPVKILLDAISMVDGKFTTEPQQKGTQ